MEAVNTLADVASKAIWGEPKQHGDEPVSGQIGDVSKGEPYDAGNIETQEKESPSQKDPSSTIKAAENESSSVHAAAADKHKDATTSGDAPSVLPSTAAADNDEDAVADPAALDKIPGPRPLDELAREGGGDAAVAQKKEHGGSSEPEETKEDSETEKHQGNAGGIAMGKGDGTQYVKTSGLQADGGDFDATKPGAGREAERLMEQKGIATPAAAQAAAKQQQQPAEDQSMTSKTSSGSGNSGGSGGKKGLKEKIKEKLHRN